MDIDTEYFQNSELQQETSEKLGLSDSGHFWTQVKHFKALLWHLYMEKDILT